MTIQTVLTAMLWLGSASAHPEGDACQPEAVLESYFSAFNAHSVDGIIDLVHEDFRWLTVTADQAVVDVSGREQLRAWLEGYFQSTPGAGSKLEQLITDGCLASTVERASWMSGGEKRSQTALASYQFRGDRILRVWYVTDSD